VSVVTPAHQMPLGEKICEYILHTQIILVGQLLRRYKFPPIIDEMHSRATLSLQHRDTVPTNLAAMMQIDTEFVPC